MWDAQVDERVQIKQLMATISDELDNGIWNDQVHEEFDIDENRPPAAAAAHEDPSHFISSEARAILDKGPMSRDTQWGFSKKPRTIPNRSACHKRARKSVRGACGTFFSCPRDS